MDKEPPPSVIDAGAAEGTGELWAKQGDQGKQGGTSSAIELVTERM
jgi:hypothetical protein